VNEPDGAPSDPVVSDEDDRSSNGGSAERVRVLKAAGLGFALGLILARWAARDERR
jgi:hypothetical protein